MKLLRVAALIALTAVALHACASTPTNTASQPAATISVPPPVPAAPGETSTTARPRPTLSAEPEPVPSAMAPNPLASDGGCGCSPCEPIKSSDACRSDADCAPSALCHAPACVAKAKAPVKAPGTMCTMNLVCRTTDVAKCACVDNVCALVGR